tara:strand:- start:37505 stop:37834 length:330 start_codon:yes stop_codon:yes gene_type:complete
MNVKYEENLEAGLLTVTVSLEKRKKARDPRVRVKTDDVVQLINENYEVPKTHILGECKNSLQAVDNEHVNQCVKNWVFILEKISEPGRPPTKEKSKTSTRATSKKKKKV